MRTRTATLILAPLLLTGCYDEVDSLTGYASSMLCSKTFVTGLDRRTIFREDLIPTTQGYVLLSKTRIDHGGGSVSSSALRQTNKAIHREGLGCTLVGDEEEYVLRQQTMPDIPPVNLDPAVPWPYGSQGAVADTDVDRSVIETFADYHFMEHGDSQIATASLAVAYQGELVYERYAPGYDADTPIYGFSIGKTMAALLSGVLVKQGRLDMQAPADLDYWPNGDPRRQITAHQLLTMTSGLAFDETYEDPVSDANMLFVKDDMGEFAAQQPLEAQPGTRFSYSSGSTQVLSALLREQAGGSLEAIYRTLHEDLFRRVGINNAVVQADTSGNLVFGMQDLISTRDMARLGQLLLNNGNWAGDQILPLDWVDYMSTRVGLPYEGGLDYGAGLWLNTDDNGRKFLPSLPEDALIAMGLRGQFILVVPSLELVIVRMGSSPDLDGIIAEMDELAATVLFALP